MLSVLGLNSIEYIDTFLKNSENKIIARNFLSTIA